MSIFGQEACQRVMIVLKTEWNQWNLWSQWTKGMGCKLEAEE